MDVVVWLRSLGLGRYEAAFRDNEIDETVLPSLTAEDLKDLGVSVVGHRRKLLDAIAALRRQVTVMFCDLVGSTALSTQFDPEDLRTLFGQYHLAVKEAVAAFDGFVAKYMGDGVL